MKAGEGAHEILLREFDSTEGLQRADIIRVVAQQSFAERLRAIEISGDPATLSLDEPGVRSLEIDGRSAVPLTPLVAQPAHAARAHRLRVARYSSRWTDRVRSYSAIVARRSAHRTGASLPGAELPVRADASDKTIVEKEEVSWISFRADVQDARAVIEGQEKTLGLDAEV